MNREKKIDLLLDSIMAHVLLQHKTEPTRRAFRGAIIGLLKNQDKKIDELKALLQEWVDAQESPEDYDNRTLRTRKGLL